MKPDAAKESPPRTDAEKQDWLRSGKVLVFSAPKTDSYESTAEREARTIQAEWLNDLLGEYNRTARLPIRIANAIVKGPLELRHASFESEVSITDSVFTDGVDFSFATFNRAIIFDGSKFFGNVTNFRAVQAKSDLEINRVQFCSGTSFQNLCVEGVLNARGATFGDSIRLAANSFANRSSLVAKLLARQDATHDFFWNLLSEQTQRTLSDPASTPEQQLAALVEGFNAIVQDKSVSQKVDSKALHLSQAWIDNRRHATGEDMTRTNRLLLDEAFPNDIEPFRVEGVDFSNVRVKSYVDFRGSEFFQKVFFSNLEFQSFCLFRTDDLGTQTCFADEVSFQDGKFRGGVDFSGTHFGKRANFERTEIGVSAFFNRDKFGHSTRFQAEARFPYLRVAGNAEFDRAIFSGEAIFMRAYIEGDAYFAGAKLRQNANFSTIEIRGRAFFNNATKRNPSRFGRNVNFSAAHIQGNADFRGARFTGEVTFDLMQFDGMASFNTAFAGQPVCFRRKSSFIAAHIKGQLNFSNVQFCGPAIFDFLCTEGGALFRDANFSGSVSFRSMVGLAETQFWRAQFKDADFSHAHFDKILFREGESSVSPTPSDAMFNGKINLSGLIYDRIGVDWSKLLQRLDPYDRQPYTQLEKFFRATGHDRQASDVYLMERDVERRRLWGTRRTFGDLLRGIGDSIQRWGWNYGVRPYILLLWALLVLAFGTHVFHEHNAIRAKETDNHFAGWFYPISAPLRIEPTPENQSSVLDAVRISARLFIPIVEIPTANRWVPSDDSWIQLSLPFTKQRLILTYADYASFHRVAGAILVPLGVAALAGLLRRQEKS